MDRKKFLPRFAGFPGWRGIAFFIVFFPVLVTTISAGVLVAPTSVILSDTKKTGRLTIQNPTDKPKEISIDFSFGLPESDSLGNVKVRIDDEAVSGPRSAAEWIKAYPRKFILQPDSTQVVRFLAKPPADLADGEYWARIMVKSQEGQTSIPVAGQDDRITTKLNMIMQTAVNLKYRTGNLISKLEVVRTEARDLDSTIEIYLDMVNRGNVSYVGLLNCKLIDNRGRLVSDLTIDLAVYHSLLRRLNLPVKPGNFERPFKVEVAIGTEGRSDIPSDELIMGNSIALTEPVH
nr:molecular chaperone [candidate division Zixibacteria bacterium]